MQKPVEFRTAIFEHKGEIYVGEWLVSKNIRQGKGILKRSDGSIYEGWWSNN
jgi:hypothetical protein